jgi:hypothetical protein
MVPLAFAVDANINFTAHGVYGQTKFLKVAVHYLSQ